MRARSSLTGHDGTEQGFSLIEVVIAIGILAGVLLSICSMFILGGRQLKTGKTMTEATTIAHDIMETYDKLSYTALYTTFGAVATDSTMTVVSTSGTNAISPWQTEIGRKLDNGSATVTVLAMGPGTPNFGAALGIRMTVSVSWSELGRAQTVALSTTRF